MFRKKKIKKNEIVNNDINNENTFLKKELMKKDVELQGYLNVESELSKALGIVTRKKKGLHNLRNVLFDRFELMMSQIFEWENVPEEIPYYIIESQLFNKGELLFWKLGGKYFVGNYTRHGNLNEYRLPINVYSRMLNTKQSTNKKTVDVDCVIVRNTSTFSSATHSTRLSTRQIIMPFIETMAKNIESLNQQLNISMTKWLISVEKSQLNNLKASLERVYDDNGLIAFTTNTGLQKPELMSLYESYNGSENWEDYNSTKNEMYNMLGISSNPNEDKKERLLVDEININNEQVSLILKSMIKSRLDAIKKINKIFGLNIKLKVEMNQKDKKENKEDDQTSNIE